MLAIGTVWRGQPISDNSSGLIGALIHWSSQWKEEYLTQRDGHEVKTDHQEMKLEKERVYDESKRRKK